MVQRMRETTASFCFGDLSRLLHIPRILIAHKAKAYQEGPFCHISKKLSSQVFFFFNLDNDCRFIGPRHKRAAEKALV